MTDEGRPAQQHGRCVVDSQGDTSVDAITSSTLSFSVKAVQEAVADCIAQAKA